MAPLWHHYWCHVKDGEVPEVCHPWPHVGPRCVAPRSWGNAPDRVPAGRLTRLTLLAISACPHLSRLNFDGFCPVRRRGPGGARRSAENVRGTLPGLGPDVRPRRSSGAREDGKRTLRRSGRRGTPG